MLQDRRRSRRVGMAHHHGGGQCPPYMASWVAALVFGALMVSPVSAKEIPVPASDAKAFTAALEQAEPGDTVRLAAGTYRVPAISLNRGGQQGKPITIEGEPAGKTMLKGSTLVTGWKADEKIEGAWKVANWPVDSQQLFVDGLPLLQVGVHNTWQEVQDIGGYSKIAVLPPHGKDLNDLKPGRFYYDIPTKNLYCMLADKSDPSQHSLEASTEDFIIRGNGQSYITLRNLSFMHGNMTAKSERNGGLITTGPVGWTIEDCQISYGDFGGLGVLGEDHIIRRCQITDNGCVGIDMNGSGPANGYRWTAERKPQNILIENVIVTGNNYRRFYNMWHAGGMKLTPSIRAITIRGCTVAKNFGSGIWFDGGLGANVVEDNLVADNNGSGIFYEISGPTMGDKVGVTIRNNRVINHPIQAIYISASSGAVIENNTCYNNRWSIVLHGMPREEFGGRFLKNNRVTNNIIMGDALDLAIFVGKDSGDNVIDGNFYVGTNPEKARARIGVTAAGKDYAEVVYSDFEKLFKERGFEQHGQFGDPQWLDPIKGDFRLAEGSPAAGKGWQEKK